MNKFICGYIKFHARIRTLTGLRIGGRRETVEIGGIDLQVIKDPITNLPYISGSSLKGKLRSLVEKLNNIFNYYEKEYYVLSPNDVEKNYMDFINYVLSNLGKGVYNGEPFGVYFKISPHKDAKDKEKIEEKYKEMLERFKECVLAGNSDNATKEEKELSKKLFIIRMFGNHKGGDLGLEPRLVIRDFFVDLEKLKEKYKIDSKNQEELEKKVIDYIYEVKVENVVNRITGTAEHPREVERVRKGIEFKGEIVYKLLGWGILDQNEVLNQAKEELEKLKQAIEYLVKYDYLGGSGSRGYGKIALWFDKIEIELDSKKIELSLQVDKNRGTFKIDVKGEQNELVNYLKDFMEKIYLTALNEAKEYGEQL